MADKTEQTATYGLTRNEEYFELHDRTLLNHVREMFSPYVRDAYHVTDLLRTKNDKWVVRLVKKSPLEMQMRAIQQHQPATPIEPPATPVESTGLDTDVGGGIEAGGGLADWMLNT